MSSASRRPRLRRSGVAAALLVGALTLSACGGSTVTSDDLDESAAPAETLTSEPAEEAPEAGSEAGAGSENTENSGQEPPASAPPEDRGAREISEIPPAEPNVSAEDEQFLETLDTRGIDVAEVEDQLLGAAASVCAGDPASAAVAGAAAGQLMEQGRTDLGHEEATSLIESSARDAYCPA